MIYNKIIKQILNKGVVKYEREIRNIRRGNKKEADIKEKNRELYLLGLMTGEELKKVNAIHSYAINRIAELIMKF